MSGLDEQFPKCSCLAFSGWRLYDGITSRKHILAWLLKDENSERIEKGHGIVHLHERYYNNREEQEAEDIIEKIDMVSCHNCNTRTRDSWTLRHVKKCVKQYWNTSRSYRGRNRQYIMTHDEEKINLEM